MVMFVASLLAARTGPLYASGEKASEYRMKAAYIFKILQFVQLPAQTGMDAAPRKQLIVVGVTDKEHVKEIQDTIGGKEVVYGKGVNYRIVVKHVTFQQLQEAKHIAELDVLYVCQHTVNDDTAKLLRTAIENEVLIFGDTKDFLESGGTINFVVKKNKLKFEINTGTAGQAGIRIRSQLMKLAVKVINKKMKLN